MDDNNDLNKPEAEPNLQAIPQDFPRTVRIGALPGAQPKFLMIRHNGRFYQLGTSPPEVYERWRVCQEIAAELANKSVLCKAGKRANMSEVEILDQYLPRLIPQQWTSIAEARWIIRRVAQILSWPVPVAAVEAVVHTQPKE